MKKLLQLSVPPALLLAFLSGDVHAGAATASGLFCRPLGDGPFNLEYRNFAFANLGSSSITVTCTIPMDSSALGTTVTFRMRVEDKSTSAGFSCVPYVVTEVAGQIGGSPARTTTAAQTGWFTLASSWTVSVPGNVNTNMYAIQCVVPGNGSTIFSARAQ